MTFAITFAVLAPMSLGIFDVFTMTQQQGRLQDALDAAALYAARSTATTTPDINTIGNKALVANLQLIPGATLQSSSFTLVSTPGGDTKVTGTAQVSLPAYAPTEFTHAPISVNTEVTRPGNNLEVSLVLDNTGSMAGTPMTSLQSAANQLIDLVVSDQQSPYYSKMAIVPYSNAVNAGTYVNTVRGTPTTAPSPIASPCIDQVGCTKIKFTPYSGSTHPTYNVSNCVSERIGIHAFDDTAYSAASGAVGWVYPPSDGSNNCISAAIQPLTSNKTTLHNEIGTLTAAGSTAGAIGVEWGWYMISPSWGPLWPSGSQPAAYGTDKLIKAMILMTDGAFNTTYCKGVVSGPTSATDGTSGATTTHAACASPNGDSFTQAQTLCTNMKAAPNNIVIYTVAFLHGGADPQAQAILANCATDAAHAYVPSTGASLTSAFQSIAADLNKLRISK
ncbi:pilus assembly protein TadG-related protein [Phenylobacterium sp.]|uniref:pilus assembly protein TadG-related protein n=1 Tax=Phenylobacterium sp. TaxID=1871053 RepID=UPI002F3F954F